MNSLIKITRQLTTPLGGMRVWFVLMVILAGCGGGASSAGTFNVRDYGARGDGIRLDTQAIQKAIDDCAITGGTVVLPPGTYLSGTIILKSHVTLRISAGATLLGSTDIKDYPAQRPAIRSYTDGYVTQSLIYGENLTNIAIVGRGTIDGQGAAFQPPSSARADRYKDRPYVIRLIGCEDILVENLTMRNAAMWMQHYLACDKLTIRGITVYNHGNRNNNMLDIDGCRNVIISDCSGDSDDDALTLKSTSGYLCENITITNCVLSSHVNAIKLGTESHGGFRNISISNIVIRPSESDSVIYGVSTGRAGIALEIVDGGTLDGITISNIRIEGVQVPLFLRLGDRGRIYQEGMERPPVGTFRNVSISNVVASGATVTGSSITGLPGHPVENISLSHIRISYQGGGTREDAMRDVPERAGNYPESNMFGTLPAYGFYIRHARGVSLSDIELSFETKDDRPALVADDVHDLVLSGFRAAGNLDSPSLITLRNTQDAFIHGSRVLNDMDLFLSLHGSETERISLTGNDLRRAQKVYETYDGAISGAVKLNGNITAD